jgi:3,4-dihydroxy-2-butanone 4-phosphate synthase
MTIEETIRLIVVQELEKREGSNDLVPVAEFCEKKNISRITLWRAEKSGKLNLKRIGRKVFVNANQIV